MNFIYFILGGLFILLLNYIVPKVIAFFDKNKKRYEVVLNISYFIHPTESSKKGEFVRIKPVSINLVASDEDEAMKFANQIALDNIKVEISSIEETQ